MTLMSTKQMTCFRTQFPYEAVRTALLLSVRVSLSLREYARGKGRI